jgi:hypothetical protein
LTGVLVLDDTIYKRNRSKHVELLTRVRDHNDGRYYKGFRCLALCFHFGKATVPVDFRLLSSSNEKTRINGIREGIDKRTIGYKLRQLAISTSFQMAFDMLDKARNMARHVLFDSWFAMPVMFKTLRDMNFHGVGMLKASKHLYRYKGRLYKMEALYSIVKPFIHRENDFAPLCVELMDGTPFSITFVQDKRNKRDWLAIGTTDLSLPPREVISLYSQRWSIEVFFKTVKSHLGFTDCQSRSFDSIVCSVAIVFTRQMVLTWMNYSLPTPETEGQLFFRLFDELRECTLAEALEIVFREITLLSTGHDHLLDVSIRDFFANLPMFFKDLKIIS